jgi:hypothetical protein
MRSASTFALVFFLSISPMIYPVLLEAAWPVGGAPVCLDVSSAFHPHIVSDGAGGSIIAWEDDRGTGKPIYAQRVDGSGNPYWAENGIRISDVDNYELLELVSDGAGGAIAVFFDYNAEIWAQRIGADGDLLWGSIGIQITDTQPLGYIVVASDGFGGFVVAFKEYGFDMIYAQRDDRYGNVIWDDVPDLGIEVSDTGYPFDIVADGFGGLFIVYTMGLSEGANNARIQRVYPNGNIWQIPISHNGLPLGRGIEPVVAGNANDGVIVAWKEYGYAWDVFAMCVSASGDTVWGPTCVCWSFHDKDNIAIMSDGLGGAYLAWEDYRGDDYPSIYAQRLSYLGTPLWAENGILIGHDLDNQLSPVIIESGDGCVIAWLDYSADEYLAGQKLGPGGIAAWTAGGEMLAQGYYDQYYDITPDGAGGLFVSFIKDNATTNYDVYAQSRDHNNSIPEPHPVISQVTDVPADQGGFVRLTVTASGYDVFGEQLVHIAHYDVWQRVDGGLYSSPATLDEDTIV